MRLPIQLCGSKKEKRNHKYMQVPYKAVTLSLSEWGPHSGGYLLSNFSS